MKTKERTFTHTELDTANRLFTNFTHYEELDNGELADSYFEKLDDALANGFIDSDQLLKARNIIERLGEIINEASSNIYFIARRQFNPNN